MDTEQPDFTAASRIVAAFTSPRADAQDRGESDLSDEVALLGQTGLIGALLRTGDAARDARPDVLDTIEAVRILRILGGANLSLGRLFEGHLNAVQLVRLYGTPRQNARVAQATAGGALLGVWGADGPEPLRLEHDRVRGAKRYASGLGLVTLALVPATLADGSTQLLLLDANDPARADASSWSMRGMRATRSGDYDFSGLPAGAEARVGAPDDYKREPWFVGGIWRCAAAQLGAVERIAAEIARDLGERKRLDHPLQMERVGRAIAAARTARLWVEDAAVRVDSASDVTRAVAVSAFSRLQTEAAGMAVIDLAERAVGLTGFAAGHPLERVSRDLSVYLRQANPDALMQSHARVLVEDLLGGTEPA